MQWITSDSVGTVMAYALALHIVGTVCMVRAMLHHDR